MKQGAEVKALSAPEPELRPDGEPDTGTDGTDESDAIILTNIKTAPVPLEIRDRWKKLVKRSRTNPTVTPALLRAIYRAVVLGQSWKTSASDEGMTMQNVWDHARRNGLAGRPREAAREGNARIIGLTQDFIETEMTKPRPDLSIKDAASVLSAAQANYEKTREADDHMNGFVSVLDSLAQQMREGGGSVRLELTVSPGNAPTQPFPVLDVTPSSSVTSD